MVSKASEDLPEPESPVTTVSRSRGIVTSMLRRLCSRAPRTMSASSGIATQVRRLHSRIQATQQLRATDFGPTAYYLGCNFYGARIGAYRCRGCAYDNRHK